MARPVTGTYRLQLHAGFTFADAQRQVPYLERLGVSHLYLSPILQAAPGSMHGYDVVDHTQLSRELGGQAGFRSLCAAAAHHGLGVVVDVVPNHMAFTAPEYLNRPIWDVLANGRDSQFADWFDIDWKAGGGRIGLPVLASPLEEVVAAGELTRDELDGQPVLRYFDHAWPLALGSEHLQDVADLLDRQHYRLACWRDKDEVLNYRRFFEVDGLIAVRVERPEVFDATHRLLLDLHRDELIDGFRIDHPDGLADPAGYLQRLSAACRRGTPIWVEKILEAGETLPTRWSCSGTTGYDALQAVQLSLLDAADAPVLTECWREAGGGASYEDLVERAKREIIDGSLAPEVDRLTRRAREALPDQDPQLLRAAIVELLVSTQVYRAYVLPDQPVARSARTLLRTAFRRAAVNRPGLIPELNALIPLTVMSDDDDAATDFGIRLQQTCGPVMAKGIEDTTFYRWAELIAVNEVGSDPSALATASAATLHTWAERIAGDWPSTMTTLSTHDTKRSEDVRARLIAIAGSPQTWRHLSSTARHAAREAGVDGPTAHFVWQTLLGAHPIDADRTTAYLTKALREAKLHTAWVDGDPDYERRVIAFAVRSLAPGPLHDAVTGALTEHADDIRAVTLGAKLIQLTMPGVPDTYQGTETVSLRLVDPDNRAPVDYGALHTRLDEAASGDLAWWKLHLVRTVLSARRRCPEAFGDRSSYTSVPAPDHLVAFLRGATSGLLPTTRRRRPAEFLTVATRAPARLRRAGGFGRAGLQLPDGTWTDLLVGGEHSGQVACDALLAQAPVAFLERTA